MDNESETFQKFFEVEKKSNTYEVFTDGSELIGNNLEFQKYKGKLDMVFTSHLTSIVNNIHKMRIKVLNIFRV